MFSLGLNNRINKHLLVYKELGKNFFLHFVLSPSRYSTYYVTHRLLCACLYTCLQKLQQRGCVKRRKCQKAVVSFITL